MEETLASKRCPRCGEDTQPDALVCRHCQFDFGGRAPEAIGAWVRSNQTLTASLATFLYVTFQIFKASDFEVNSTVELLRAGGLTGILVGVLLQQLPLELLLLSLAGCWWLISTVRSAPAPTDSSPGAAAGGAPGGAGGARTLPVFFLTAVLVLSFYATSWPLFLVALVVTGFAIAIAYRRHTSIRPPGTYTRRVLVVIGVLSLLALVQRPTIWVPAEAVTTTDHSTIVAFVIAEDDGWTTLLTPQWSGYLPAGQNSVIRKRTDEITSRQLCAMNLLEAQLFGRVLRLRPVQIIPAISAGALPPPLTPRCPTPGAA